VDADARILRADLAAQGAIVHRLDVTDEETVASFGERACVAGCVVLLINAVGVDARAFGAAAGQRGPFELSAEHFLEEVRVNAVGPMLVTRALVEPLLRSPAAKVVNLSSRTGSMTLGAELCWDIGYNASKAALNAVTVRTARLLADRGVIVVAMHPGSVRTQMGGEQADLEPDDAADQLVSTIASLTLDQTGTFLKPDGTIHPW
jgi:NAD(P)-dependent dehydrogenase (short-subunit alcohol dehydrogenase family)